MCDALQKLDGAGPQNIFLAVLPDRAAIAEVSELGRKLSRVNGLEGNPIWPFRLHVTLFSVVGGWDIPQGDIDLAIRAAAGIRVPPFEIVFNVTQSFYNPRNKRPFVLCSGDDLRALNGLRHVLAQEMKRAGLDSHVDPAFCPHMTLIWSSRLVDERPIVPIRWTAREFVLVRSHVGESRHEYIGRWTLRD